MLREWLRYPESATTIAAGRSESFFATKFETGRVFRLFPHTSRSTPTMPCAPNWTESVVCGFCSGNRDSSVDRSRAHRQEGFQDRRRGASASQTGFSRSAWRESARTGLPGKRDPVCAPNQADPREDVPPLHITDRRRHSREFEFHSSRMGLSDSTITTSNSILRLIAIVTGAILGMVRRDLERSGACGGREARRSFAIWGNSTRTTRQNLSTSRLFITFSRGFWLRRMRADCSFRTRKS